MIYVLIVALLGGLISGALAAAEPTKTRRLIATLRSLALRVWERLRWWTRDPAQRASFHASRLVQTYRSTGRHRAVVPKREIVSLIKVWSR